jgi:hypothetical protein
MNRRFLCAALLAILASWSLPASAAKVIADQLTVDGSYQVLFPGQMLIGRQYYYRLEMQWDGNLVVYGGGIDGTDVIWSSGTAGVGGYAALQPDGDFVIYDWSDNRLWGTGTSGMGASTLIMQDDGNLVIYRKDHLPIWASYGNFGPVLSATMPDSARVVHSKVLPNRDLPGSDFTYIVLKQPLPSMCGFWCAYYRYFSDRGVPFPACAAYTYVPPGVQGDLARCWLKTDSNMALTYAPGMVSGFFQNAVVLP